MQVGLYILNVIWVSLIQTLLNSCIQIIKTTDLKGPRFTEVVVMGNESSKPRRRGHVSAIVSFGAPQERERKSIIMNIKGSPMFHKKREEHSYR